MGKDDFTLTIDDVARRLNKSVRTIHRYKDSGKLSHTVGAGQGNPLLFSRFEVDLLAQELSPRQVPTDETSSRRVDPQLWERMERVERLLQVLENNPFLEQMLTLAGAQAADNQRRELEELMQRLARTSSGNRLDNKELGRLLVRLGSLLQEG